MGSEQDEHSAGMRHYTLCPLTDNQRSILLKQIDIGKWKHSWHLPDDIYGRPDWNNLTTITKIRDVLVDQITDAKNQLRDAERCLKITVDAMIKMESDAQ